MADKDYIDFVFTWVDGGDAVHQSKRNKFATGKSHSGAKATRFNSSGEILFGLKSIEKFAPWVHRIFIITDNQFLPEKGVLEHLSNEIREKISIIDHKVVFAGYEHALPTFNSRTIESVLWRIPELAEHFVYFNDDVFLNRPITPSDFFDEGRPIHRGKWSGPWYNAFRVGRGLVWNLLRVEKTKRRASFKDGQILGAIHAGYRHRVFLAEHTPLPALRSRFELFFEKNPNLLLQNISFRFRDYRQYSPMSLARHLDIAAGQAITTSNTSAIFLKCEDGKRRKLDKKLHQIDAGEAMFVCVSSLDEATDADRNRIIRSVTSKLIYL